MTSCVTTKKSPNLSEPCSLYQGPAGITSRHNERIQMGKKDISTS